MPETTTPGSHYRVQIVHSDGRREIQFVWGNGATNAHWLASNMFPDAQVGVLGVVPEYDAE
jgi:hypothetical protein